jgi:hypothetical protein
LTSRTGPCHGLVQLSPPGNSVKTSTRLTSTHPKFPPLTKPTAPAAPSIHFVRYSSSGVVTVSWTLFPSAALICYHSLTAALTFGHCCAALLISSHCPKPSYHSPFSALLVACRPQFHHLELVFSSHLTSFYFLNSLRLHQPSMRS